MLISKLNTNYPMADTKYLVGDLKGLDPIFIGRLAYYAFISGTTFKITEGFRTKERQEELYRQFLRGEIKSAAKAGTSWHEYGLAVDTSSKPIRQATNEELKKYGLCKPISYEGWHIQPIETLGKTNRKEFAPMEKTHWGEKHLNSLVKKGIIISPEAHINTLDETMTKAQIFAIIDRITEVKK